MSTSLALFYLYALGCVVGAIGLVAAERLVHAVMWLLLTLVSIAGVFLLMGSTFLAGMQLFVYGGAITILVLFVLMLSRPSPEGVGNPSPASRWVAIATAAALLVGLAVSAASTNLAPTAATAPDIDALADVLFGRFVLPFEIAGLLLTIALIGAIVLARSEPAEPGDNPRPLEVDTSVFERGERQ